MTHTTGGNFYFTGSLTRVQSKQPKHFRLSNSSFAVVDPQFAVDVFKMRLDGIDGDVHRLCHLLVGQAVHQQVEHVKFAVT